MKLSELVTELLASAGKLPEEKRAVAIELCVKTERFKKASAAQIAYMVSLLKLARGEAPKKETAAVGDMAGVTALFDRVKDQLVDPSIVIAYESHLQPLVETVFIRLRPSKRFGNISVNAVTSERQWLGSIYPEGTFDKNRRERAWADEVVPVLQRFAADPATGAKESARLTGKCVFCNTKLTDERSTDVGYGKKCASRYGLPWGEK